MEKNLANQIAQTELTRGQSRLADYILKNQKRVLQMTADEIGQETGMSDASVIRFCRAIGYKGFADFKSQLRKELSMHSKKIGKHSLYERYVIQEERYQNDERDLSELLNIMGGNLETSLRQNTSSAYQAVANGLLAARKKVVVGMRGGKGCAICFARLLQFLTRDVLCISDESRDAFCSLGELTNKDTVLLLNFSRHHNIDEKIGEILQAQGVPYFLITDNPGSPLAAEAQQVLMVETEQCGFFHSMIGTQSVLEYLLLLMSWAQPEMLRVKLQQRDAILAEYGIESN